MSSTTTESMPSSAGQDSRRTGRPLPGPTFIRVLNSEVIKFRSLLSTLILLASTAVVMVGFGALSAWGTGQFANAATRDPQAAARIASQGGDLAVSVPTSGIAFAQLILGSLGVLLMSSEFTTGMARSTFAAVPRRLPAFGAKLVVVMVTSFVVTAASTWVAGLVAVPI
ncbi:MAG TPA: ABC transporter permease, partial [Arthrobacter sp.]|nr:ABC transporter permease [Arthrobacter sp.]